MVGAVVRVNKSDAVCERGERRLRAWRALFVCISLARNALAFHAEIGSKRAVCERVAAKDRLKPRS